MKKFTFIFAGLALLASAAFTSCEKTPAPSADEGTKSIALSINFGGVGTKAEVTPDDPWAPDYKEYESLDLYFTSSTGSILYYYHAAANAEGNGLTIWNGLMTTSSTARGSGVRFLGMEGVNRVFVVANGPQIAGLADEGVVDETTGKVTGTINISALNNGLSLDKYAAKNQDQMIYAGATFTLKEATGVSESAAEIEIGDRGAVDYEATVTIRPAVSRLEVNDVAVTSSGYAYFSLDADGNYVQSDEVNGEYRVEYSGFEPSLVGVYMSNVYKTSPLFPKQTDATAGQLFATPTDVGAIKEGTWVSLASEGTFANCLQYSNYAEGTGYSNLIPADYIGTADINHVLTLFDGDKTPASPKVIPFNFFVPYDITDESTTSTALPGAITPSLHFQFKSPASFTVGKVEKKVSDDAWTEITDQTAVDIKSLVEWPDAISSAESGIAFANVVKFYEEKTLATPVTIRPGYIYQVGQVLVSPVNLEITSQKINTYNVAVVVTVVPYTTQDVYPGFE